MLYKFDKTCSRISPLRFWFSLGLIHQVSCSVIHACDGSIATAAKAEGNAGHRATLKTIQLQLSGFLVYIIHMDIIYNRQRKSTKILIR